MRKSLWIVLLICAAGVAEADTPKVDLEGLQAEFMRVELQYAARSGKAVHDGTEEVSPWRLLREHLQPYAMDESPYATGTQLENELLRRARRERSRGKRLGPADLYRIGLELNQGNRLKALLTAHDALKKTGRGLQVGEATPEEVKARVGSRFFERYMGDRSYAVEQANPMGEAFLSGLLSPIGASEDTTGKYYHLFGSAASGLVGGIAGLAPGLHARMKDTQSVIHKVQQQTYDYYGEDTLLGRFLGQVARPVGALASGLGSFGEYSIVHKDKYAADIAGVDLGRRLRRSPPIPAQPEPLEAEPTYSGGAPAIDTTASQQPKVRTADTGGLIRGLGE